MKQQESNQFDKGMSLDTNPIAMDNHTLSGALNATMITMNGNELVLQNDMGNARVETAYLPDGFVPVGMKEHGGVVYVASYNPINGQSQIGSFPSPERNLSNQDTGASALTFKELDDIVSVTGYPTSNSNLVKTTYGREAVQIPSEYDEDKDIIRPGDQVAFYGQISTNLKKYAELSAIIVDSDNNSIDITKDIIDDVLVNGELPENQPTKIPYYKGKISGKVFLVETLKLPSYLQVKVGATKNTSNGTLTLELTPSLDNENFISEEYKFYFKYNYPVTTTSGNSTTTSIANRTKTVEKTDGKYSLSVSGLQTSGIFNYEVWLLMPYGRIASIYRSGSIDLAKVGTGEVEFKYFFYYNDIKREQIQFDYDILAYLKDNQEIVDCYLSLQELDTSKKITTVDDQTQTFDDNYPTHKIELPIDAMGGSFSSIIPFGSGADMDYYPNPYPSDPTKAGKVHIPASTLAMGKIYFGKLKLTTSIAGGTDETKTASTPLCIITSSVVNEYYMDHSTESSNASENFMSMLASWSDSGANDKNAIKIQLSARVDWTDSTQESVPKETNIPSGNTYLENDAPIISENEDGYDTKKVLFYGKQEEINTTLTVTPKVKILYPDESFPLDEKIIISCMNSNNDNTYTTDINWTASSSTIKSTLSSDYTFEEAEQDKPLIENITDQDSGLPVSVLNKKYVQKISSDNSNSKIAIIFKSTLFTKFYGQLSTNPEMYEDNDAQALVPYMNFNDLYKVQQLTATTIFKGDNPESDIRPKNWFSFETYESGKNNRNRKIAIMNTDLFYETTRKAGKIPSQGDTTETGSITLFHTTSTNANWNFYSKTITDYYHNDLGMYPSILFLQGCDENGASLRVGWPKDEHTGFSITDHIVRAVKEEADWESGEGKYLTSEYCIPIMFSTSGDLYMLNEFGLVTPTYHPLSDIVKQLEKIYVLQSGQVIKVNYKKTNEYIYMMPYTLTVNVPVRAVVSVEFENYPKYVQFGTTKYVLPKFTLNPAESSNGQISEEYIASFSVSNPDVYSEIESYINAQLQISSCAIVPNDGSGKVITYAKWNQTKESIDSSHPYYWNDSDPNDPHLEDCYTHEIALSTSTLANYLNKEHQYLVIRKDVDTDYNTIYVNKSVVGKIVVPNSEVSRSYGVLSGKETRLGDIAPNHVINGIFGLPNTLKFDTPYVVD